MDRRSFLMRLGAGMIGALVIRPTIDITDIWKPTQRQIDFLEYGSAGGGKSLTLTTTEIIKIELERIMPKFKYLFEQDSLFDSLIKHKRSEYVIRHS